MIANRIANLKEGRPSKTRPIEPVSQAEAAEMMNVSLASVKRARQVIESGDQKRSQAEADLKAKVELCPKAGQKSKRGRPNKTASIEANPQRIADLIGLDAPRCGQIATMVAIC
jgi:hypothetical protein